MRHPHWFYATALLAAFSASACSFAPVPPASPTAEVEVLIPSETPSLTPSLEVVIEPSPSLTLAATLRPQLESPTPSNTPGPPTETETPTPTEGPIEYVIVEGDTLGLILSRYGYNDIRVFDEVMRINPIISNVDRLPGPGTTILIPRPTGTPTPEGFDLTATARGPQGNPAAQPTYTLMDHIVKSGETIVGIAGQYRTTLEVLDRLNPELIFSNCDFSNPSGGPDCNVALSIDQAVHVPAPTPTMTLSPTPSGSETPTPTPTLGAPSLVYPPSGALAQGSSINLQWVSAGLLDTDEAYLIEIEDQTAANGVQLGVTRTTSYQLTSAMVPADGQIHQIRWRVRIGELGDTGNYRAISGEGEWRALQWQR
jgi:hypothetical protein